MARHTWVFLMTERDWGDELWWCRHCGCIKFVYSKDPDDDTYLVTGGFDIQVEEKPECKG